MVLFFVNGALKIIKYDYLPEDNSIDFYEYSMRFLTETTEPKYFKITMYDSLNNQIVYEELVNGLKLLELDCTPFIEKFNHQRLSYVRVHYQVQVEGVSDIIEGSFPIISPIHEESLKFACVSCNNNKKDGDDGNYNYQNVCSENLWEKVSDQEADIIIHTGNQIYGDYIYNWTVGRSDDGVYDYNEIYQAYANLYRTAYSEVQQGRAMRNSLNLMILEGNDIFDSFGTPGSNANKDNPRFTPYYSGGMKAYLNYQHQLHSDLKKEIETDDIDGYESLTFIVDDYSDILMGNSNIYYAMSFGRYTFILMDQRYVMYHGGMIMPPHQLIWLDETIKRSENRDIIIICPRPIGNVTSTSARISGLLSNKSKDDPLHPRNIDQTVEFLNILNDHKTDKNITIVSGYIRKTYTNAIQNNGHVAKQLVTGPITRKPKGNDSLPKRLFNYMFKKTGPLEVGDFTIDAKENISYGNGYSVIDEDEVSNNFVEEFENLYCSCIH